MYIFTKLIPQTATNKRTIRPLSAQGQHAAMGERGYQYYNTQKERHEVAVAVRRADELRECTFSPAIGGRRDRDFAGFLKEQRDHSAKQKEFVEDLASELAKKQLVGMQSAPKISKVITREG